MPGRSRIPLDQFTAHRIALLKPSALGDIVHSLPVLTALRQRFPAAHITWVVNRSYEPLLTGHRDLSATLPFDRGAASRGTISALKTWVRFLRELRRQQFDLVIDLQGLFRSGLMARVSGAPRRVGLSTAREGATWFYTDVIPVADFHALHAVDRYWRIAEALGVGDLPRKFHLSLNADACAWADGVLVGHPRPWVMVGAGSRWVTKRWPTESFALLLRRAYTEFGGTMVLVGAPNETELSADVHRRLTAPVLDVTGRTSLPQLAALLSRADVMLANDTGPLHVAAALGRPVVAPYTCTKVLLNGPYGSEAGAVESRVWCQGSYLKRCARMECMEELTPECLWPHLHEVLQSWQTRPHPHRLPPPGGTSAVA
jgi:lipopolysaccharide heptosyltransferase I